MKKITIVWTITLLMILTVLTCVGFKIKEKNINSIMENSLTEQAKKYLGLYTNEYPKSGNKSVLTYEYLLEKGYDAELEKDCTGYVEIKNENVGFKYNAYIKCPNYITNNYDEKNNE